MTHCSRCGLVSENDDLCSWCGVTLTTRPPQVVTSEVVPPKRDHTVLIVSLVVVVVLATLLFLRFGPSSDEVASATEATSVRQGSNDRSRLSRRSNLPRAPSPRVTNGMSVPLRSGSHEISAVEGAGSISPRVNAGSTEPIQTVPQTSTANETSSPVAQGVVHLVDARLAMGQDGEGEEVAGGRVIISNEGPYDITDFRVSLQVAGTSYELMPFSGSPDDPVPLVSRTVKAGARVEIPVMTTGPYRNENLDIAYRVVLRASLSGPPGTVTDSVSVPSGGAHR